ncbi:hypothetical protein RIR_jg42622.t3 [Rhizophagus irregularis DAOM 181602=DAOM 197198]|nr:hypothetical protein RIR_jg42622.t3 [Rhizophagus irregularis DAOM 181602=DAOM 197198]
MVVNRDVQNANHRLKHALNLLIHRCRETYEERDILKAERDRSRKERDELQDELEFKKLIWLNWNQQYNLMRGERNRAIGERNRAIGERDAARNRLVYANNRVLFGIRTLGHN